MTHSIIDRLSTLRRDILSAHLSRRQVASAVAVGLFIGTSPFFGLHLLLCLAAAAILRLNILVTYAAANVSLPWFAPFIAWANIEVGHFLLHREFLSLAWPQTADLSLSNAKIASQSWLLGWLVLGAAVALIGGGIAFLLARRLPPKSPRDGLADDRWGTAVNECFRRYARHSRMSGGYVRGKLRWDPVYRQLADRLPLQQPVLDLGCGRGQTLALLHHLDDRLRGVGWDWDAKKIALAQKALADCADIQFATEDLLTIAVSGFADKAKQETRPPEYGTILIIDVLHYMPFTVQDRLVQHSCAALAPGGRLFIRDLEPQHSWRSALNVIQERLATAVGFNRGHTLAFRSLDYWATGLSSRGFSVEVLDSHGQTPLANRLLIAQQGAGK